MGEYTFPDDYKNKIDVIVNPEKKTLKFIDTGLGMTAAEVEALFTIVNELRAKGATDGDNVRMGDVEFEFIN